MPAVRNPASAADDRVLDDLSSASLVWGLVRILVIDDQPDVALVVAEVLESEGHQALVAGSGEEGLRAIEQSPPDAVFLDVVMPGIDGIEVLRRIRKTRPHLPVILLSGTVSARQKALARVRPA